MILNITTVESGRAFSSGSNESAPGQRVKILYQDVNKAIDHGNRGRSGLALAPPLLAALLLLATLMPSQLPAQTNTAKAPPSSHRWLLIVETSRSMQRRSDAVLTAVQDLLTSGMVGQLRPGDTLGVWTFNSDLYTGRFPLQTWSPEAQQDIVSGTLAFLKGQKYEKKANFDKVLPVLTRVISDSGLLTVLLVSSGDEKLRGTPYDSQINEYWQKWHDQQQKARMPFVTILRASAGQVAECTVNTPPWPTQLPRLARPTQIAEPIREKPPAALHQPPPPIGQPLIISGKKPQSEKALAPKPEPAVVKVEAPAPTAAVPSTNNLLLATPPAPAAAPKPLPAPVVATAPKAEALSGAETKPLEPAPAMPEPAATVQILPAKPKPAAIDLPKPAPALEPKPAPAPTPVLAPPVSQAVSAPALVPPPSSSAPPPSSKPPSPAQTATAVPGETFARHSNIWIAALFLAGVATSFAVLRLRRSRTAPQASLITRSFERKHKP